MAFTNNRVEYIISNSNFLVSNLVPMLLSICILALGITNIEKEADLGSFLWQLTQVLSDTTLLLLQEWTTTWK